MKCSKLSVAPRTLALLTLACAAACGGGPAPLAASTPSGSTSAAASHASPSPGKAAAGVKEPGDAKIGDTAKCPVSGEEFTVEATSPKVEHDGKTYFLCCGGCKKKFESNPQRYLKKS